MGRYKKYGKITYEKRLQLIKLICQECLSYKIVCKRLNLRMSTAKIIVKKYKQNGQIFQTKQDKMKRECLEEYKSKLNQNTGQIIFPVCPLIPTFQQFIYIYPWSMPIEPIVYDTHYL